MIGQIIANKYNITALLGRGGMGSVYKAIHIKLGREDALKILHPDLSIDPAFIQRFMREARAMAKLSHENIIRVYDVFEEGGTYCIAMELFDGAALNQYSTENGLLPLGNSVNIVAQAAHGLATAHAQGIVHRDIKPGNVMLNPAGIVKVTDFGIAAAVDEAALTTTGQLVGSPRYMSPEQARGQPADHRSDLYSLGMVFYELVTGTTPYNGDSGVVIIGKLAYQTEEIELNFSTDIPTELQCAIKKLLYRDPAARFQDAGEFCNYLLQLNNKLDLPSINVNDTIVLSPVTSSGFSSPTSTPTLPHISKVTNKRSPVPAVTGLAVLTIVVAGFGFYIFNMQNGDETLVEGVSESSHALQETEQRLADDIKMLHEDIAHIQLALDTVLLKADATNAAQLAAVTYQAGDSWAEKARLEMNSAGALFDQGNLQNSKNALIVAKQFLVDAQQQYRLALEQAKQKQLALVGESNLSELQGIRELVDMEKQQARIAKGKSIANKAYREAVAYEEQGNAQTANVQKFIDQNLIKRSEEATKKAKQAFQLAAQNYEKSVLAYEAQHLRNKVNKNHSNLRQQQLTLISSKDLAEQAQAQQYANELYQKAIELNTALTEESLSVNRLINKKAYAEANAKLNNALLLAQEANSAYKLAGKSANEKLQQQHLASFNQAKAAANKPTVKDIEAVEKLLFNFEQAYESKDLNQLKAISLISEQQLSTIQQIFSQYMTIGVSITSYSLTGDAATAEIQIDKLVTHEGDEVVPGENWRNTHLEIIKGREGWEKISWN